MLLENVILVKGDLNFMVVFVFRLTLNIYHAYHHLLNSAMENVHYQDVKPLMNLDVPNVFLDTNCSQLEHAIAMKSLLDAKGTEKMDCVEAVSLHSLN